MLQEQNDRLRNFFSHQVDTQKNIQEIIKHYDVTPQKFPKLIDIFAGDAPVAKFFNEQGWTDITTADISPSNPQPSFVKKSLSGDLVLLSKQILTNSPDIKDSPFLPYYHQFDILTCFNPLSTDNDGLLTGGLLSEEITPLINFFLKKNAFYLTDVGDNNFGFLS